MVASDQVVETEVALIDRRVEMADTGSIGVALVGIGRLRGTEEVELAVGRQVRRGIDVPLDQAGDAALPGGEAELRGPARPVLSERDGAVRGIDVGRQVARAEHAFEGQEAARREGDALVAELVGRADGCHEDR
jgi:hypothetical protein